MNWIIGFIERVSNNNLKFLDGVAILIAFLVVGTIMQCANCGSEEPEEIVELSKIDALLANKPVEVPEKQSARKTEAPAKQAAKNDMPKADPDPEKVEEIADAWIEASWVKLVSSEDCPEGFWSILPEVVNGRDEFERRENKKKQKKERPAAKKKVLGQTYITSLPAYGITLGEYDFKREAFPLTVSAMTSCHIIGEGGDIALSQPKIKPQFLPSKRTGRPVQFARNWDADPLKFSLSMPSEEAAEFRAKWNKANEGFFSDANKNFKIDVVFKVNRVKIDPEKTRGEYPLPIGAGPVIIAKVLETRIQYENDTLLDTKKE